ncbi:MATE family efflux transporter [Schlegelella sp. S2-27]|uniref:MATE family efflux transporter n=1 Tax=Caldimonas mangrovi TaxID=2944811 RepID=A0ABT0YV71_9BURK|nr:MATE family efflux transporter [Caldimonas mangrovi]MCM5682647.1 MATE family efflux transporter [Caldimonas mangrovi]
MPSPPRLDASVDPRPSEWVALLRLATPIVVGLCVNAAMGVVDSAIVAPLGPEALGAVALTSTVLLVFVAALYGFLSPGAILVARAFGAGDAVEQGVHRRAALRLGLWAGSGCTLLMLPGWLLLPWLGQPAEVSDVIAPYWVLSALSLLPLTVQLVAKQILDAMDRPWAGVGVSVLMVALNAAVGGALVACGAGLWGAALGSLLAYLAGMCLTVVWACRLTPCRGHAAAERAALGVQRREGLPMGAQYLLECGATAVAGLLIGLFGVVALAAHQIAMSVTAALYMVPLGLAAAVGLRMSHSVGAGAVEALRPQARAGLVLAAAWMAGFAALLALAGEPVARAFTARAEVVSLAAVLFAAMALMQVADGLQSVSLGALRGLLDSHWPTRVSLCCYWLLALPAGWWLAVPLGLGPAGIWMGFGLGLCVAAAALMHRLRRQIAHHAANSNARGPAVAATP